MFGSRSVILSPSFHWYFPGRVTAPISVTESLNCSEVFRTFNTSPPLAVFFSWAGSFKLTFNIVRVLLLLNRSTTLSVGYAEGNKPPAILIAASKSSLVLSSYIAGRLTSPFTVMRSPTGEMNTTSPDLSKMSFDESP